MNENLKKAQAAAHTPEANAKRAATLKKRKAAEKRARKVTSIPLEAIPDDRPAKKAKLKKLRAKVATADGFTREKAALEIVRLTMWLAQN